MSKGAKRESEVQNLSDYMTAQRSRSVWGLINARQVVEELTLETTIERVVEASANKHADTALLPSAVLADLQSRESAAMLIDQFVDIELTLLQVRPSRAVLRRIIADGAVARLESELDEWLIALGTTIGVADLHGSRAAAAQCYHLIDETVDVTATALASSIAAAVLTGCADLHASCSLLIQLHPLLMSVIEEIDRLMPEVIMKHAYFKFSSKWDELSRSDRHAMLKLELIDECKEVN